jgi:hypothetical protein
MAFDIRVTNKIEITSKYNFNKDLIVVVYNNDFNELYRTHFIFEKGIIYWIETSQLNNIIVDIIDNDEVIYRYKTDDDFAYVTCGDLYYMDLVEKLVISLLNVSDKKIIVYGINCKVPFDYPNLIKREIVSPIKSIHDKWFWKQQVCIEALKERYSNYVWMDGDIIANINIESISKYFSQIENYPLCEVHVQDEQIYVRNGKSEFMGEKICEFFGYNRKVIQKDLHACFFVYNRNCEWFFREILETYQTLYDKGLYDELLGWNDESLHNFMHSKYGFTKTLPLSNLSLLCEHSKYESNPKVLRLFYGYWNEDSPNNFGEIFGWSYVPEDKNQILYFHENKNLEDADEMIEFVKMKKNDSFNSSKWFFIDKYKINNFEKNKFLKVKPNWQYLNNLYEQCSIFEYRDIINIEPNDIVVDTLADVGFFERYCYLKKASKVICFESSIKQFELLQLNSHKDSILFNADVDYSTGSYLFDTGDENITIDTYNIDYLFYSGLLDKIDFLKIDNNNELSILNGISDINLQKIKKISIKFHDFNSINIDEQNIIIDSYLKRGFNSFVDKKDKYTMLYFYKK